MSEYLSRYLSIVKWVYRMSALKKLPSRSWEGHMGQAQPAPYAGPLLAFDLFSVESLNILGKTWG